MKKKIVDFTRVTMAVILFSIGLVNLKNFSNIISPTDVTWGTFFAPLMWMAMMGLGLSIGAGWVKRQFHS